jgi:3-isopropylmalate/(R)-2-methylmalate dehydratase small subunit
MQAYGIRCVIGHQLAEFFMDNCLKNGVLPIELDVQTHERVMQAVIQADGHTPIHVDLRRLQITIDGAGVVAFHIDAQQQRMLLEGLDEISMTLKHIDAIERWERATQRVT